MMMRGLVLLLPGLILSGCFNPEENEDAGDTGDSSGSTAGTMSPAEDTVDPPPPSSSTAEPTGPGTDDTTAGAPDEPPTIELLVDGSNAPADMTSSGRVTLSANAADDSAVAQVEFAVGGEVVATLTEAPYEIDVVVTSADNPMAMFSALATDDAGQDASDEVSMGVNITGGAVVASLENLFHTGGLILEASGGPVVTDDGDVIVAATIATAGLGVAGVGAVRLLPDLAGLQWQSSSPPMLVNGQPEFLTFGRPVLTPSGSDVRIAGNSMGTDTSVDPNVTVFRISTDGLGTLQSFQFPTNPMQQNLPIAGLAQDADGNLFVAGPDHDLMKLNVSGDVVWQTPVGLGWTASDFGGVRIRTSDEGDVVFDTYTCPTDMACIVETRLIDGLSGTETWSRDFMVSNDNIALNGGGSAFGPDGEIVTLHGPPPSDGGGIRFVRRDLSGNTELDTTLVAGADHLAVADFAFDEQGMIVALLTRLVGGDPNDVHALALRLDVDGNVLWQQPVAFGSSQDLSLGLAVDGDGHVLLTGVADPEFGFFSYDGDLWIAALDL